jgi:16S rRNA (uracil1498-N3)-methyltransferase
MDPRMVRTSPPTAADETQDVASVSIRLHVAEDLRPGERLTLAPGQAHYLGAVMRRGSGDRLRLFNGRDGEHLVTIGELRRERCVVTIGPQLRAQEAEPDIWLAFALLKRGPTELIVQKATELGVGTLVPMFTTRTNADRANVSRLQAIAIEAAEQSERLSVPLVHTPRALSAVLSGWPAERRLVACFERNAGEPIARGTPQPCGLMIGPEGGFTDAELDAVRGHPFVVPATLGPRVLRAETAAIVGLALLQAA